MALSILNNISSMAAQNQLSITGASLQKTLGRLASGSRINSGADDAAGLAIADGLKANVTALTQSARNATDGIGKLQVADGALAQVTNLLNRAVTLATESANGTVSAEQRTALNSEFSQIKQEIDRIGSKTTYNGQQIFGSGSSSDPNKWVGATGGLTSATALTATEELTITDTDTGKSHTYTVGAGDTMQELMDDLNGTPDVGVTASLDSTGHLQVTDKSGNGSIVASGTLTGVGALDRATISGATDVYLGDGTTAGGGTITTTISALSSSSIGTGGSKVDLSGKDLTTASNAQSSLTSITAAISNIAADRGTLGAVMNRLQSATNVINNQVQNLSAAEDGVRSADIASEVANMTKFNILQSTGMSALAQSNQMQQAVLQLLR